jgi:proteasome lid subunit RPN8/RPN11
MWDPSRFRPSSATETLSMTRQVYDQIESTIGCLTAETGGMIGGDRRKGLVTHFHFDGLASKTGVTYSPDVVEVNRVLSEVWTPQGVELLGFVHSHPGGPRQPSPGDLVYAENILKAMPSMSEIILPIVMPKPDTGRFEVLPFTVFLTIFHTTCMTSQPLKLAVVDDAPHEIAPLFERQPHFARVVGAYDLARLERSRIVAVGCGGSASFLEDMARAGVGEFV